MLQLNELVPLHHHSILGWEATWILVQILCCVTSTSFWEMGNCLTQHYPDRLLAVVPPIALPCLGCGLRLAELC